MKNKVKILLVEDEDIQRETFASILKEEGYIISTAKDGFEAIKKLNKEFFNIAIIDMKLPGMNGIDILRKAKDINCDISVIIITAYASVENTALALNEGADAYILKPPNIDEIKLFIKKSLIKQELIFENRKLQKHLLNANNKLKNSYLTTLKTLARALELRDPFTRDHSSRVTDYSIKIAKKMGFSKIKLDVLRNTGFLHDIGKVAISDLILQKKDKLTENEWNTIKKHPEIGEEFIDFSLSLYVDKKVIRNHHERYDGKGYPDGLKGEDISLFTRILTVSDAYDAMTSSRPYRDKMSVKKAIFELKDNSGTQFDPEIVDIFLNILKKEENLNELDYNK